MNVINFPEHWKVMPLEKAVNVFNKKRIPINGAQRQQMQGEYPYCGANGVVDHVNNYLFDGEYVLLAEDGGYWGSFEDSAYLMSGKFWVNNHAHVLQAKQGLSHNYFLTCQLNYLNIKPFISGTTRGKLNQGRMKQVPLALPPLPEQRAIAHTLQTIQEAKFTRQREIVLERERKAALMDYLFSHGTKGEPRKQTEIGEMPESWEVVRLGDYCYKPGYGYTESANDSAVGPKFLRITDIQNDTVNWQKVPYCVCGEKTKEKYLLKTGDIVIARIGATTGKAYIIDDCPEAIFASYLIRVQTKDNLSPVFLAQYFRSNNYWRQIEQSKGGRLKGGVNIPILTNLVLPLPPLPEQRAIANIFRTIDEKTAALEKEVEHIDELFHAMLEELMTGQRSAVPLIDAEMNV